MKNLFRDVGARVESEARRKNVTEVLGSWLASVISVIVVVLVWEWLGVVALIYFMGIRLFIAVFIWAALQMTVKARD